MILKTIAFILVVYFLIKLISRIFLPESAKRNARIIFRTFQNIQKQQRSRNRPSGGRKEGPGNAENDRLEEIEEAEFEDITNDTGGDADR